MIIGIAEIKALATGWPVYLALDRDALCDQVLFPRGEILFRNCEREVQLACGPVRRDHAAGRVDGFQFAAASEDEEHVLVRHAEYAETFVGFKQPKAQLVLVEANRAGKIVGVEAGFDDAVHLRCGHVYFSSQLKSEIPSESIHSFLGLQRQHSGFGGI